MFYKFLKPSGEPFRIVVRLEQFLCFRCNEGKGYGSLVICFLTVSTETAFHVFGNRIRDGICKQNLIFERWRFEIPFLFACKIIVII